MKIEFSVTGIDDVKRTLDAVVASMRKEINPALRAEAGKILEDAKGRTPYDTGKLQGSGRVLGTKNEVKIAFGGGKVDYAVIVHELERTYRRGERKFLERAINKAAPYVARNLAIRLAPKKV